MELAPAITSTGVPCWANSSHSFVQRTSTVQVGRRRGGGGEQVDPLTLLLFNLAIHNALVEVKRELLPCVRFLDDIYVVCSQARVRTVFSLLSEAFRRELASTSRRQNTRVEQSKNLSSQHGRFGPRSVERRGDQDLGHPSRFRCAENWKRNAVCRRPFHGAGRSMWLANPLAVRWTPLSPLLEDSPSFTIHSDRPP